MKISLDAAMRARDVSQPTTADEAAAAELRSDSRGEVTSPPPGLPGQGLPGQGLPGQGLPGQGRRPRPRGRPRPGHGFAGSSPDSS